MYQKIDQIMTFKPESQLPTSLSDCFVNEKAGIRTTAGIKILAVIIFKSLFIVIIIGFVLTK